MVVVVGQRHGTVPGAVKAITEPGVSLGGFQTSQDVTVNCTALSYKVKTALHTTDVELRVQRSLLSPAPTLKLNQTFIRIHLKECPIGFTLYDGMCVCTEVLANRPSIECVLDPYPAILHSSNSWIGYYNSSYPNHSGIIYYEHCPPGYCTGAFPIIINTSETSFDQNAQCSSIREGLLCGSCPHGTSVVFGSQECLVCSSVSSAIVIFAFMAVGIVVVVCMNAVPMLTVTSGEINGLVFYANVMQIMLGSYSEPHVQYFILSFLNLDQGVKFCFYNGMDTFAKVFIESVFPLYLFVLALFIIFLCRKYQRLSDLLGKNSVKVLATLFFFSYAKIVRIIILIFSVSILNYPDGSSEWRWSEDGNILFARGKHLFLIAFGFIAVCFSMPYTIIVTFHPYMQRSRYRCLNWIHRLKPLLDAYSGIYKDNYRFWTGLLLFARLYLFLSFTLNVSQDSYLNSLSVLLVCVFLLSLGWIFGGVYKDWKLDILEASYIINLAIFSGATLKSVASRQILFTISVGMAFLIFLLIFIWKYGVSKVLRKVSDFVSRRRATSMTVIPPNSLSWEHVSGTQEEGNAHDGEGTPLLS